MKILIALIAAFTTQMASASFLDHCLLDGSIIQQDALKTIVGEQGEQKVVVPVTLKVKKVVDKGGHTDCQYHMDSEIKLEVESVSLESLAALQKGHYISVDYFHVSGLTPTGVYSNTRATLQNNAQKAFDLAMQTEVLSAKVEELYQTLGVADEPVVLLKSSIHHLPEGICGFVGCSQVYIVTLTYGQSGYNAPTQSVVAKVVLEAIGDFVHVQILK